jgi:hypothetical protein
LVLLSSLSDGETGTVAEPFTAKLGGVEPAMAISAHRRDFAPADREAVRVEMDRAGYGSGNEDPAQAERKETDGPKRKCVGDPQLLWSLSLSISAPAPDRPRSRRQPRPSR